MVQAVGSFDPAKAAEVIDESLPLPSGWKVDFHFFISETWEACKSQEAYSDILAAIKEKYEVGENNPLLPFPLEQTPILGRKVIFGDPLPLCEIRTLFAVRKRGNGFSTDGRSASISSTGRATRMLSSPLI